MTPPVDACRFVSPLSLPTAACGETPFGIRVVHYGDAGGEYRALTAGVGLVEFPDRTQIELTGADRAKFLHNLCTNEIRKLASGAGCEAYLTNVQGKIQAHLFVFCGADSLVLETVPGCGDRLVAHLDRYIIRDQVELRDQTAAWGEFLLAGAGSGPLLQTSGCMPPAGMLEHAETQIAGAAVSVRRVPLLASNAFLLSCARSSLADVGSALLDAGAAACGFQAFETARIEAGFPSFGQDITNDNLPQEVARDQRTISFVKGCYLGQEVVARIDALGHVNKLLTRVVFVGDTAPSPGMEFHADGRSVGHVTSAAFSPKWVRPLALAYLKRGWHTPGTRLQSDVGPAEVFEGPI